MELVPFVLQELLLQLTDQHAQVAESMKNLPQENASAKRDMPSIPPEFALPALPFLTASSSMEFAQFVPTTWSTTATTAADVQEERSSMEPSA